MNYRHVLKRRTFLKGSGIALGLPFLDCMTEKSAFGAPGVAPPSVISLYYGLGTPNSLLDRGLTGTLQYYKPLLDAAKISMFTNIDMIAAYPDDPVTAQHHYGQPYLFSGFKTNLAAQFNVVPQGPTMQYMIMKQQYPTGTPTPFKIMDCGIYFRRAINYQRERIYDEQGKNAADFADLASPVDFFDNVFGKMPTPGGATLDPKVRASRSIIDYLVPEYQRLTGAGSRLPARDIAVLKNHVDRVRQLETMVYGSGGVPSRMTTIMRPTPPAIGYKIDGPGENAAYRVAATDFEKAYQILADLFVAGLQSDYYRFGNLSFDAGGGHTYFTGAYPTPDNPAFTFNGAPHANYHAGNAGNALSVGHNFFVHKNVAQALAKLDSKEFLAPNGKTYLDNCMVLVGSEVGHNHDVSRMHHIIGGGDGRFKMGINSNARIKAIELYNALGKSYGMAKVGDGSDYRADATVILA